jgi:hypothetical protein
VVVTGGTSGIGGADHWRPKATDDDCWLGGMRRLLARLGGTPTA